MELVNGESLEKVLSAGRALERRTAISMLAQVADGLDYAHAEGVVHRDVKPANILVRPDGKVKITDFGISRIVSQTVTRTGFTMGTPAYMSPEQVVSAKVRATPGTMMGRRFTGGIRERTACGPRSELIIVRGAFIWPIVVPARVNYFRMWRVQRLDQINAFKPADLFDFKSLTLKFRSEQIDRFKTVIRTKRRNQVHQPTHQEQAFRSQFVEMPLVVKKDRSRCRAGTASTWARRPPS
jgi:serine/threonine protein kinase